MAGAGGRGDGGKAGGGRLALRASIASFRYPGAAEPALSGIELSVGRGEFVVITGPAAAGKTTLCYCLTGVIPRTVQGHLEGEVRVMGRAVGELPLPQLAGLLGLVMQHAENQLFNVKVLEDVAFGPENLQLSPQEVRRRAREALDFTGASHLADRFSHLLSGGETQRVVLASILALGAEVYVLDQPAAELDPAGRRFIYENIRRLNEEAGKTIILVEDRLSDVLEFIDRVFLLEHGRIVREGPPRDFFTDPEVVRHGVRLPDAVRLYHLLRDQGVELRQLPLTVGEAVEELSPLVRPVPARPSAPPVGRTDGPAATAVAVHDLVHVYPTGVRALDGMSLGIRRGEFVAVVGENGAGKTTLAKHLVGLLRPTEGRVEILGRDIAGMPVHRVSQRVGLLFQDPDYQIFNASCLEEVAYGLKLRRLPLQEVQERALAALERMELLEHSDAHPYTLSRGQRQRLAVATVLALGPEVLIVDEPSTGLDYRETLEMMGFLEAYCAQGGTVMVITHDMEMATRFAHRIVVMSEGRVLLDLTPRAIFEHLERLERLAILLPDVAAIARGLGLAAPVHNLEQLVEAIAAQVGSSGRL